MNRTVKWVALVREDFYARVKNPSGRLTVKWGPGEIQQCTINYSASAQDKNNQSSFVQLTSVCGE